MTATRIAVKYAAECPCDHTVIRTITTEKQAAPNRIRIRCRECDIINYASSAGSQPVDTPEVDL